MSLTAGSFNKKQKMTGSSIAAFSGAGLTNQAGVYQDLHPITQIFLSEEKRVSIQVNVYIDHYAGLQESNSLLTLKVNQTYYDLMFNNEKSSANTIHKIKMSGTKTILLPAGTHEITPNIFIQGALPASLSNFAYKFVCLNISYLD